MKMKMKALVAATAMAIGAQAQAAINDDSFTTFGGGTGAGELFLSVIDRGGPQPRSYLLDLGITASQFLANDAGFVNNISILADANLQDLLTNSNGTIAWNIAAAHNTFDAGFDNFGFLTTSGTAPIANNDTVQGQFGISGALQQLGQYVVAANEKQAPGQTTNFAVNNSVLINSPADNAFYDGPFWGDTWTTAPMSTETGLGSSMGFYFVALDFTNDETANSSRVQSMLGEWSLSANGTLSYNSVVPVPAAVWLLGSALIGMVGVARRKSNEQA